jgi:hypothetical protein
LDKVGILVGFGDSSLGGGFSDLDEHRHFVFAGERYLPGIGFFFRGAVVPWPAVMGTFSGPSG